jgi:hypothetical protein
MKRTYTIFYLPPLPNGPMQLYKNGTFWKIEEAEEKIIVRTGSKTARKLSKMKDKRVIAPVIDVVPPRVSRLNSHRAKHFLFSFYPFFFTWFFLFVYFGFG